MTYQFCFSIRRIPKHNQKIRKFDLEIDFWGYDFSILVQFGPQNHKRACTFFRYIRVFQKYLFVLWKKIRMRWTK